jgi:hypothetical protein
LVDESVTVKGSPVRSLQKFVDAELTPEQREAMFRNLPPDYASRFRGTILPTETVPVDMLNRLTEEAALAKGEPLDAFAQRAGRDAASDAVHGIYRFFAQVMTPNAVLGKAAQIWGTLYNCGEMRVEEQTANSARIRVSGFPAEIASCSRATGWMERLAELTGVRDLKIEHPECAARGASSCSWTLSWR